MLILFCWKFVKHFSPAKFLTFLAHLSTRCSRWAIVITLCPASGVSRPSSIMCRQQFIQSTSPPKLLDQFRNNFTQTFPWSSFTKIAKMVLLCWTKWPPELKIEKTPKTTSSPRPVGRFQNNFTEMFLGWPSTKIAKMVLLRWTKWPSKLKIEKPFKRHLLLGQWADSKIILQECSLDDPLPKLLKWFCSAEQNGRQS